MSIVLYQWVSLLHCSHCQVMEKHDTLRYPLFYGHANRYLAEVRNRSDHM
jgi:hypothetical protein